jgi:hypothetical protein
MVKRYSLNSFCIEHTLRQRPYSSAKRILKIQVGGDSSRPPKREEGGRREGQGGNITNPFHNIRPFLTKQDLILTDCLHFGNVITTNWTWGEPIKGGKCDTHKLNFWMTSWNNQTETDDQESIGNKKKKHETNKLKRVLIINEVFVAVFSVVQLFRPARQKERVIVFVRHVDFRTTRTADFHTTRTADFRMARACWLFVPSSSGSRTLKRRQILLLLYAGRFSTLWRVFETCFNTWYGSMNFFVHPLKRGFQEARNTSPGS